MCFLTDYCHSKRLFDFWKQLLICTTCFLPDCPLLYFEEDEEDDLCGDLFELELEEPLPSFDGSFLCGLLLLLLLLATAVPLAFWSALEL